MGRGRGSVFEAASTAHRKRERQGAGAWRRVPALGPGEVPGARFFLLASPSAHGAQKKKRRAPPSFPPPPNSLANAPEEADQMGVGKGLAPLVPHGLDKLVDPDGSVWTRREREREVNGRAAEEGEKKNAWAVSWPRTMGRWSGAHSGRVRPPVQVANLALHPARCGRGGDPDAHSRPHVRGPSDAVRRSRGEIRLPRRPASRLLPLPARRTPMASLLLDRASTLMRRPTGSSRGHRPVTPIAGSVQE